MLQFLFLTIDDTEMVGVRKLLYEYSICFNRYGFEVSYTDFIMNVAADLLMTPTILSLYACLYFTANADLLFSFAS